MRTWWRSLFARKVSALPGVDDVNRLREAYGRLSDQELRLAGRLARTVSEVVAVTAVVASRVLGLTMFDVQLQGAIALSSGHIVEMQTGEGKTLAAVPAAVWHARSGRGVHVLTANDYLAQRDAMWMGGIYEWLGLSVGAIQRAMSEADRRMAYRRDVTYATANEVGFDYLRDCLARKTDDQVHRPFAAAVIDEADSILIDEARVPLVIAGGEVDAVNIAGRADRIVRDLRSDLHVVVERHARSVTLTAAGVAVVERLLGWSNLFDPEHLAWHTAIQDALHAHMLLKKDVDYIVTGSTVLPVDEFKGRVVPDRRWPAGLQTALESKEGVHRQQQGRVLGSITIEHLVGLYPVVCGMTGTAVTQAEEFRDVYGLEVTAIPPHRPVIRIDHPDVLFATRAKKEIVVCDEIRQVHGTGRPVLVGTASVDESERLSRALSGLPHQVLNARHEADEAAIVAQAGARGAVTISTNMAGRGVDIRLGPGVAELGGLHVIGTNRHESRRIDHQLRGRAGRQGDPGSSRFFVSREDPLALKYADGDMDVSLDQLQRIAEGQNLDIRLFLRKYELVLEGQRLAMQAHRQALLTGEAPCSSDAERQVALETIDDLWADFIAAVTALRNDTVWVSLGGRDPMRSYLIEVHRMFRELQRTIDQEVAIRLPEVREGRIQPRQRGATWTYLTTDEPFGSMTARVMRGLVRVLRRRAM
jgi:preprotein translocase subunit SecA